MPKTKPSRETSHKTRVGASRKPRSRAAAPMASRTKTASAQAVKTQRPGPQAKSAAAKVQTGRGDMPATIARSDRHAQSLWRKTRASAIKTYGRGARAARVAFSALKHEYEKRGDRWVRKDEAGPSDAQAARGPTTRPRSTDRPTRTAGGHVTRRKSAGPAGVHAKAPER